MHELFSFADGAMGFLPAWVRIGLWGTVSAALSMWLYLRLSPQARLASLKQQQRESRRGLYAHEGSMGEMYRLIGKDLRLSLAQLRQVLLPVLLSILPVIAIAYGVLGFYTQEQAEWIYFGALLLASLAIKCMFRIH
jgi:hypothetical protein